MTSDLFLELAVVPALALLPDAMDSVEARAMILSVALQESGLTQRRQLRGGPARSFLMFERAGIEGVLTHHGTADFARGFCQTLDVRPTVAGVYAAIEYQDVLAAGLARLLLWTLPAALPGQSESDVALQQYLDCWKPGRPRPETWASAFTRAWATVGA